MVNEPDDGWFVPRQEHEDGDLGDGCQGSQLVCFREDISKCLLIFIIPGMFTWRSMVLKNALAM